MKQEINFLRERSKFIGCSFNERNTYSVYQAFLKCAGYWELANRKINKNLFTAYKFNIWIFLTGSTNNFVSYVMHEFSDSDRIKCNK